MTDQNIWSELVEWVGAHGGEALMDSSSITAFAANGGVYTIQCDAYIAECRAKIDGDAAKRMGIDFQDNPYRKGPPVSTDWLYSAWEHGYVHGVPSLDEVATSLCCSACVECVYTGCAWHAHTCGMPNVEITQESI